MGREGLMRGHNRVALGARTWEDRARRQNGGSVSSGTLLVRTSHTHSHKPLNFLIIFLIEHMVLKNN